MLKASGLSVEIGGRRLLDGIDLELRAGELLVLVGPNGAGKTTLLKACLGLIRPTRGAVEIAGQNLAALSARERARHLAWLPQLFSTEEAWPAEELVATARYRFQESRSRSLTRAREILGRLGVSALCSRPVTELSGGERQRVAFAVMLAQEAPLCLLDEPATHLDPAQEQQVYGLVAELVREGLGLLAVTHDLNAVVPPGGPEAVRVVGLDQGKIAFERSLADHDLPEVLGRLFGITLGSVDCGHRRLIVAHAGDPT